MKYLNFFRSTGKYDLRMTQNFIDTNKVKSIKKSLYENTYDYNKDSNIIAYEFLNNIYYITEGHHRIQASLELWKETKDYSYTENLIKKGLKYSVNKAPINFNFKF